MSCTHLQKEFLFLSIFRSKRKITTTFYNTELADKQEVHYRISLLSGKKETNSKSSDLQVL